MRDKRSMDVRTIRRLALILSLCGFALVASAGEPVPVRGGTAAAAEADAPQPATVASCSPAWRLSVDARIEKLERRTSILEDQVDGLEAAVDEVMY